MLLSCLELTYSPRFYMDLCAAVPYFSMDKMLRREIWDDGLHLTKAGYQMMGEAIGARMAELLSDEGEGSLMASD